MEMNWLETNRANWDERVKIHLAAECYDLSALRSGRGRLQPIEEAELGLWIGSESCICSVILAGIASY
jgi:hypothetical protein